MGAPSYHTMEDPASSQEGQTDESFAFAGLDNDGSIVETYTSLIQQYLSVMCVENATFLAERLVATDKSSDSLYLLALCHHRAGAPLRALQVLEDCRETSANVQYLLAKSCYDVKHYGRAEEALLKPCREEYRKSKNDGISRVEAPSVSSKAMEKWILSTTPCPIPNGAAGLFLLGNICRKSNRKARAINYYRMSLKLDPFLWSSYESLCELGGADDMDPTSVFGVQPSILDVDSNDMQTLKPLQDRSLLTPSFTMAETPGVDSEVRPIQTVGTPSSGASNMQKAPLFLNTGGRDYGSNARSSRFETPGLTPIPANTSTLPLSPSESQRNPTVVRRAHQVAARLYYQPSPETPHTAEIRTSLQYLRGLGRQTENTSTPGESDTPVRRGGGRTTEGDTSAISSSSTARKPRALFMSSENNVKNTPEAMGAEGMDQDVDEDEKPQVEKEQTINESSGGGVQEVLELLCVLGCGWRRLCQYRCREALQLFSHLPQSQQNTGWVLNQQGRAYFEMNDFQNAQRCLEMMQSVEPHRMKGLDLLSTVYWQLRKEVELAHLAQRTVDFDRLCPEAWCVVGNCFSLQKEHESALSFFKRSLQLDPSFTYTHTLSGYEYMANEDFEKAVSCFRNAIRADDRHYNAWYGLGAIYHRQEKYDLAEYHFERAVSINSQSSVLRCNMGIAQFSNGKTYQALDTLAEAFRLDPRNPQARFQRATIYSAMNRPAEALAELEKVRDAAPREATVHFAMGRMLKRLGRLEEAMKCFLTAMDLDPKDNQLIKSAMDKLDEPDIDEEDYSKF